MTHQEHEELKLLLTQQREINMKLQDLLTINNSIKDQLTKIDQEIIAKLADLQAAIDALTQQLSEVELSEEQAASVTAVQDAVNAIDAIIPDTI
jgi:hypothetical protein